MSQPLLDPQATLAWNPTHLERALADRLGAREALSPVAVVVPTARLGAQLALSITRKVGALAGVQFVHHRALCEILMARAALPPQLELPAPCLQAAVHALLGERSPESGRSQLQSYLSRHPAATGAAISTFTDLRDAGVNLDGDGPRGITPRGRDTLALFGRVQSLWVALNERGYGDLASVAQAGLVALDRLDRLPFEQLHHYGAYDLVGVHRRLLRALSRRCPMQWWSLGSTLGPAVALRELAGFGLEARDLETEPAATQITFSSCAHPRQELRRALRQVASWYYHDGVPLDRLGVITRRPSLYQPFLASELRRLGLRAETSWRQPLAVEPAAQRWRSVFEFLRGATTRNPAARASVAGEVEVSERLVDAWHRRWRETEGLPDQLAVLAEIGTEVGEVAWIERLRDCARHAAALGDLLAPTPAARAVFFELLDADWQRQSRREREPDEEPCALRILDLHQARGIPLRRAVLIGFNDGLIPHLPVEDPFLPDRDRRRLKETLSVDLREKAAAADEEKFVFSLAVHSVSEKLEISHHRAEMNGRPATRSALIRLLDVEDHTARVPPHPRGELEATASQMRLLTAEEALVLTGLARPAKAVAELAVRLTGSRDELAAGLVRLAEVESFESDELSFDGDFGGEDLSRPTSPSALSELGRCPLRYAFRHVLGIKEPDDDDADDEPTPRRVGEVAHAALESFYRGLPAEPSMGSIRDRLLKAFERALAAGFKDHPLPEVVRSLRARAWCNDLLRFVTADLEDLSDRELTIQDLELADAVELEIGPHRVPVRVRFDRLLRDSAGHEWIGDYKWQVPDKLLPRIRLSGALRGRELQLPIYWLARKARGKQVAGLELLGLRSEPSPLKLGQGSSVPADLDRVTQLEAEILKTIEVLLEVRAGGHFPLVSDSAPGGSSRHQCGSCPYRRACRHHHAPTLERVMGAARHRDFFALQDRQAPRRERSRP